MYYRDAQGKLAWSGQTPHGDRWGQLVWSHETRRIKVWVDWDELTADEARDLAQWLQKMADELDAETQGEGG